MPDVDPLAFDIAFALTHNPIPAEVKKVIRALPDARPSLVSAGRPRLSADQKA